ncbi:MAG: hypothetical protein ACLSB9_31305 [Hydrogeniiclostridium mannosilyticum]
MKITASHTVEGYADRVNKCRIGIQFGVNGATDRLFCPAARSSSTTTGTAD